MKEKKHDLWWWITRPVMIFAGLLFALSVILEILSWVLYFALGYSMGSVFSWIADKIQLLLK